MAYTNKFNEKEDVLNGITRSHESKKKHTEI